MFAGFLKSPELRAAWSLGNSADSRDLIGNDRPVAREALPPLTFCISREAVAIANTLGVSDGMAWQVSLSTNPKSARPSASMEPGSVSLSTNGPIQEARLYPSARRKRRHSDRQRTRDRQGNPACFTGRNGSLMSSTASLANKPDPGTLPDNVVCIGIRTRHFLIAALDCGSED